jgi:hypothetical protein
MKRAVLLTSGIILMVAALAGAAYIAGRLLQKRMASDDTSAMAIGSDGRTHYQIVDVDTERAKELPDRPSDLTGLLIRAENNSVYIGIGARRDFGFSATGSGDYDASDFDAIVEVVVTRGTEIYKDVTGLQGLGPGQKPGSIRQKVAPLKLDELSGQGLIMAWGERRGDRLIADVVLCRIGC